MFQGRVPSQEFSPVMAQARHSKVFIIGSGAAGLTAAIYTARANLKPVLVQGLQPGGQITITSAVEKYPGFADVVHGPCLMEQMMNQDETGRQQSQERVCQSG